MYIYSPPRQDNFHRSGLDNGAYLDWINERDFDEKRYLDALDVAMDMPYPPYMAVVPDLVGKGRESLAFSMRWLDRLPTGWPWYLALQDGMEVWEVTEVIHRFEGLFLGGTDAFKREAQDWRNVASIHCKRFHFARAGTERKIKQAIRIGADSLDSSFPLWTVDRLRRMEYLVNDWQQQEQVLNFQEMETYSLGCAMSPSFRGDLCASAKKGRCCPDDLCHGADVTLCGFDKEFYETEIMRDARDDDDDNDE